MLTDERVAILPRGGTMSPIPQDPTTEYCVKMFSEDQVGKDQLKIALAKADSARHERDEKEQELYQMRRTLDAVKAERDEKWELAVQMEMGYRTCVTERDALAARLEALEKDPLAVCEKCDAGKRLEEARVVVKAQRDKWDRLPAVGVQTSLDVVAAALAGGEGEK